MTFEEVLAHVQDLLQREKRIAYRGLKRRLALDDESLEDLKAELIDAKRVAVDEDGKVLVWAGRSAKEESAYRRIGEGRHCFLGLYTPNPVLRAQCRRAAAAHRDVL